MAEREKILFSTLQHPFIIKMFEFIEVERNYFFLFEYPPGGNIYSLVHISRLDNDLAVFYAAQVVLMLEYLHSKDILFRSFDSEKLYIGSDGYLKVTDFFHAKQLTKNGRTYSLSGTSEYLAPEIILFKGHGLSSDWWSLGVLIYELFVQITPFQEQNEYETYEKIIKGKLRFIRGIQKEAKDLMRQLVQIHPSLRLGNLKGGINDIKQHKWFEKINWEELKKKNIQPPHIPKINGPQTTSCDLNEIQPDDPFFDW